MYFLRIVKKIESGFFQNQKSTRGRERLVQTHSKMAAKNTKKDIVIQMDGMVVGRFATCDTLPQDLITIVARTTLMTAGGKSGDMRFTAGEIGNVIKQDQQRIDTRKRLLAKLEARKSKGK